MSDRSSNPVRLNDLDVTFTFIGSDADIVTNLETGDRFR